MGYSYEGYYVDPVALREFAAKTAPETPPGEALNRLYSFCENNGSLLELEDAFKDTHPSWFLALDHTMQKLGIPECLSLSNLICAQVPPFPYPHNEEICFGYLSGKDAATLADKLVDVESMPHEEADSDEIVYGLVLFRQCCRNAVAEKKDIVFIPLDYLDEETDVSPSDFSASPSSSSPNLGKIRRQNPQASFAWFSAYRCSFLHRTGSALRSFGQQSGNVFAYRGFRLLAPS